MTERNFKSQHNKEYHLISVVAYAIDLYSDSTLDLDTVVCFLDDHIIKLLPKKINIYTCN